MPTKAVNDIPALYESYFLRDLTYSASGGITIASASLVAFAGVSPLISAVEDHASVAIALLVASYVLGLLVQEGLTALKVFTTLPDLPDKFKSPHVLMARIAEQFGKTAIRELERTIYLKHVGSSLGAAFLLSSLLVVLAACVHRRPDFLFVLTAYIPLFIVCLILNREKLALQNRALTEFAGSLKPQEPDAG